MIILQILLLKKIWDIIDDATNRFYHNNKNRNDDISID